MKSILKITCFVLVSSILWAGSVTANTITGTGHIYNTSQGGIIDNWYFSVSANGQVTIDTTLLSGAGFDSEIYLFRNDGVLSADDLITSDDDSGAGYASHIDTFLTSGNYLLRVSEWDFNSPGTADWEDSVSGDWYYNLSISGEQVSFDQQTPVPEPGTILLLGGGLSGLAFWRRKQSN